MNHRRMVSGLAWLLPLLLLAPGPRLQALMMPFSTAKLVDMSEGIVEGQITEVASRYTGDRSAIVTEVTLEPTDVLLGAPGPVTFLIEGGRVDDVEQWVSDMPKIKKGTTVLVFLRALSPEEKSRDRGNGKGRVYALAGAAQGLHHIHDGKALKGNFSILGDTRDVEVNVALQDLKNRIRRQLEDRPGEGWKP